MKRETYIYAIAGALFAATLVACSQAPSPVSRPVADPAQVAQGERLYRQHCIGCHGERGRAAPGWEKPGPDGKYPPPPLDGSAHAWHHPHAALAATIRHGTQRIGGNMPAWGSRLNDADIDALIAYLQSLWPDEIYAAWADIERRSRETR
jgi:mono/diheme cytochrome c family protein